MPFCYTVPPFRSVVVLCCFVTLFRCIIPLSFYYLVSLFYCFIWCLFNVHPTSVRCPSNIHSTFVQLQSNFRSTFVWHPFNFHLIFIRFFSNFYLTFVLLSSNFWWTSIQLSSDFHPTSIWFPFGSIYLAFFIDQHSSITVHIRYRILQTIFNALYCYKILGHGTTWFSWMMRALPFS